MPEDKLFVASTVEVPVTLRRNGWRFDRVEVGPADDRFKQARWVNGRPHPTQLEMSSSPGRTTTCRLEVSMPVPVIKMGDDVLPAYVWKEKYEWKIEFPAEMPDYGFAEIRLTGASEYAGRNGKAEPRDAQTDPVTEWRPRSNSAHCTVAHFSRIKPRDPAEDKQAFVNRYGAESGRHWFEDWRTYEALDRGPAVGGGGPLRHLMVAGRPQDRKLIVQDAGATATAGPTAGRPASTPRGCPRP
jgi:hypothetical protein